MSEVSRQVDVVDTTWVGATPARVAPYVRDAGNWRRWWPDLTLVVTEDRGVQGVRWSVGRDEGLSGRMEVWLQSQLDGTVVHYFLVLDGPGLSARRAEHLTAAYRARSKSIAWALGDLLEPDRARRLTASATSHERPFVL